MADKIRVSQETINEIQKLGMKGALSKWNQGGNSAEFDEAIRRYYGRSHRIAASSGGTAAESGPAPKITQDSGAATSGGTRSALAPAAAKAAATRRAGGGSGVYSRAVPITPEQKASGVYSRAVRVPEGESAPKSSAAAKAIGQAKYPHHGRLAALEASKVRRGEASSSTKKKESKREAAIRRAQKAQGK